MRRTSLLASMLVVVAACGGSRASDPSPEARPGQLEHGMEHCPSAVPGARTIAHDVPGGIALDITALVPGGEGWIREVAASHPGMGAPRPGRLPHTGEHGGPGTIGRCPIIHVGTQVSVAPVDGGVRVTMLAVAPLSVDALRSEARARVRAIGPSLPASAPSPPASAP